MLLVGSIIIVWHSVAGVSSCVATAGVYTVASTWGLCCCWGVYIYIYFEASGIFKGGNHAFYGDYIASCWCPECGKLLGLAQCLSHSVVGSAHILFTPTMPSMLQYTHRHRL